MNNIQNKLLALLIVLMTVPMTGWAQEVQSHAHNYVNSVCTKCGFQRKLASSNVGAVGILDGREAIVVELNINGVTKKVAVATMNVGATSVDEGAGTDAVAPCHGKMFTFADANNASKTGLSDGWYVPSKDELEALMNKCSWNGTKKGLEWISEDHGTSFFLPVCGFTNPDATTPIYRSVHADYWTSTESDASKGWNLFFNADGKQVRAFDKTYKFNIRPFHELGEISGIQLTPTATNVQGFTNEDYTKAFDGNTTNKWCGTKPSGNVYVDFQTSTPTTVGAYYLYTGADINYNVVGGRNPKAWVLYAKVNTNDSWTAISTVTDGELPTTKSSQKIFVIANEYQNYSYKFFRFEFSSIVSGSTFEIGEIGIDAEHFHTFPTGSMVCNSCGYIKPHDHEFDGYTCTKCGFMKEFDGDFKTGDVGILYGREAIIVELDIDGAKKKVAVATKNVGVTSETPMGTKLSFNNANDPSQTGLTDVWYVPSKKDFEALINVCAWNSDAKVLERNFSNSSFILPAESQWGYALYWTSTEDDTDSNKAWAYYVRQSPAPSSTSKTNTYYIRPFHEIEISGDVNEDVHWSLNFLTNVLTFKGTGSMNKDSSLPNKFNWEDYTKFITSVVIGEGITEINARCFMDTNIESVSLPSTLTSIGDEAFKNCVNIQALTLPASLNRIGAYAFSGCTNLQNLNLPVSVKNIGAYAFQGCTGIQELMLHNTLESIGANAFYGCTNLKTLVYEEGTTEVLRAYATSITTVVLPSSVTKIGTSAFEGCANLQSITIPGNVTTIMNSAFQNCANIESITLPSSVKDIGHSVFRDCINLKEVTLPNSLEQLGERVFQGCTSLTSIELPASLQVISRALFLN